MSPPLNSLLSLRSSGNDVAVITELRKENMACKAFLPPLSWGALKHPHCTSFGSAGQASFAISLGTHFTDKKTKVLEGLEIADPGHITGCTQTQASRLYCLMSAFPAFTHIWGSASPHWLLKPELLSSAARLRYNQLSLTADSTSES